MSSLTACKTTAKITVNNAKPNLKKILSQLNPILDKAVTYVIEVDGVDVY